FALFEKAPEESVGKGIGHFFGAMEIEGFEDVEVFKKRMDHWIEVFRATKPAPGQEAVLIPGDPEHEAEKIRTRDGVPVIDAVVKDLESISKETAVAIQACVKVQLLPPALKPILRMGSVFGFNNCFSAEKII